MNDSLSKLIINSTTIVHGLLHFPEEGETVTESKHKTTVRLEVIRILAGDGFIAKTLSLDPYFLEGPLRFRFRPSSSHETVIFFSRRDEIKTIHAIEENDLILPVVRDPISQEKHVKIPSDFGGNLSLRDGIKWCFSSAKKNLERSEPHFILLEEFNRNIRDLGRDLGQSLLMV